MNLLGTGNRVRHVLLLTVVPALCCCAQVAPAVVAMALPPPGGYPEPVRQYMGRPEVYAQQTADHLIVPGQRIGPVHVGDTEQHLLQVLGPPERQSDKDPRPGDIYVDYWGPVAVNFHDGVAYELRLLSENGAGYKTVQGFTVGATAAELTAGMGTPLKTQAEGGYPELLYYPGIVFSFRRCDESSDTGNAYHEGTGCVVVYGDWHGLLQDVPPAPEIGIGTAASTPGPGTTHP